MSMVRCCCAWRRGIRGVLCASQIATAEENNLAIAVYGRTGGLKWAPGESQRAASSCRRASRSRSSSRDTRTTCRRRVKRPKLPPGHPEGFFDAMGNIYRGVAKAINGQTHDAGAYPGIDAGVRGMRFVEAVLKSSRNGNVWVDV